ncbi:serine acetyltransferase [Aerococcus urinaehominis]|uniref:Serine acetyltransferase n=1 Tax=Aerococcus urinaehominis TaxID=128944 RepID=A0A0X8FMH9_9LACT|nr:serine acetyltransferase [Aerococcus urinaehominis]
MKELIGAYKANDVSIKSSLEVLLTIPGVHALGLHRVGHFFYRHRLYLIARLIANFSRFITGIEIHPGAQIGRRLVIDHGGGTVIGETAVVGDDVMIFHGVTLGGTGKDKGKRHPDVGDGAMIGAHAQVLGPICIGAHAKVGAGAIVLKDVPAYATAVGNPARNIERDSKQSEGVDKHDQNLQQLN